MSPLATLPSAALTETIRGPAFWTSDASSAESD
jgi:hypothetical protein